MSPSLDIRCCSSGPSNLLVFLQEGYAVEAIKTLKSAFSAMTYPEGMKNRDADYYQNLFCISLIPLELDVR